MRLRDAMFAGRIAGLPFLRTELALPGDSALQLRLNFLTSLLFQGIGATDREDGDENREEERPGLHLLILGTKQTKSNRQD